MIPNECDGCDRAIFDIDNVGPGTTPLVLCKVYDNPFIQHGRLGGCAMRTHNKDQLKVDNFKLNPLKASKRGVKV